VDAHLDPDITSLAKKIRANDCIVVTSYFGRPIADNIKAIAASRPDVLWIEDRAQALDSGCSSWADVVLYSPRKLIGVADGGVLVSDTTLPEPSAPVVPRSADAQLARRRDPDGHNPSLWFPAFRMQEEMFKHDDGAMSEATQYILERIALPPISERRRSNAGFLAAHLGDILLWPDDKIVYAPLAVPICVQERDSLAENLAGHGIFCARHWAKLPSAPELFPMAHQLSNALLSLPCDQRYDISDMTRIVKTVRAHDAKRPIL
jgi:dTDP-4-amino-4,6-dideoxygalactose transaminase